MENLQQTTMTPKSRYKSTLKKPSDSISPHGPNEKKPRKTHDFTPVAYRSAISELLSTSPKMNPLGLENLNLKNINRVQQEEIDEKDKIIETLKQQVNVKEINGE
uniref:Uncharacterized protein n=1 Tax=Panagrolaimus superbus TaxID=310955 RepID=A0A914YGV2_9BILA